MPRPQPLDPTGETDLPAWQRGGRAPGSQGELTAQVETQRLDGVVGPRQDQRRRRASTAASESLGSRAAEPRRPHRAWACSPDSRWPLQSVHPDPMRNPVPLPSSSTGYQAPRHGHSKEWGRQHGGGWGGSCSKVQAGVWEHLHWDGGWRDRAREEATKAEGRRGVGGNRGWRQVLGEKRRETPTPGGGDRVGRAAPQEATRCLEETSLPPVSHLWCLHAYSSSVPTRSSINTCRRTLITRQV